MKRKQALQATALFIATTLCFSSCRQELPNPWADPYDPFAAMTEEETKEYEENLRIINENSGSDTVSARRAKEIYIDDYEAYQHFVEHGNSSKSERYPRAKQICCECGRLDKIVLTDKLEFSRRLFA